MTEPTHAALTRDECTTWLEALYNNADTIWKLNCVDHVTATIAHLRSASAAPVEGVAWNFCWLVERTETGITLWRSLTSFKPEAGWTADAHEALQFARKEDAQAFIDSDAGDGEIYVAEPVEHGFAKAPAATAPPSVEAPTGEKVEPDARIERDGYVVEIHEKTGVVGFRHGERWTGTGPKNVVKRMHALVFEDDAVEASATREQDSGEKLVAMLEGLAARTEAAAQIVREARRDSGVRITEDEREALQDGADLLANEAADERAKSGRYPVTSEYFAKYDSRARLAARQSDMLRSLAAIGPLPPDDAKGGE